MSLKPRSSIYARWGKRSLDMALAVPMLVLAVPVMLVVGGLVRWRLGAPALFRQRRLGRFGREFMLYKFRSMLEVTDDQGRLLPDDQRLTAFGRMLRSLSLDELPQLWNIVCGDMSLVGPRPLLTRYRSRYTEHQARRHEVTPGITGWAQVNGRNAIDWNEKLELDVWYVDHMSFVLDLKILVRTLLGVLLRRGISSGQHATMPEFMGRETSDKMNQQESTG